MPDSSFKRFRRPLAIVGGVGLLGILLVVSQTVCISAWLEEGIAVDECPEGDVIPTLLVDGSLRRGTEGTLGVTAMGHYTTGSSDLDLVSPVRRFDVEVVLVPRVGPEVPLDVKWKRVQTGRMEATATLPSALPDGEHKLRVKADTAAGDVETEVRLPVFAPAKVHVLTDRPLYQPGDEVQYRSVIFRAADLVPLEQRPGRFRITDPTGEVLLDEAADADAWAVARGSFPLDALAATGVWRVLWVSGDASSEATFQVEPFQLPRFRIEAHAEEGFYRVGEVPRVEGQVTYSSGAPVDGADLEITWFPSGGWPPPTAWLQDPVEGLPRHAVAKKDGRFELELPTVPADLVGQARVLGSIAATDAAGDRVTGSVSVLLAEDAIQIETLTELPGGGLVQGFNNRLYLKATTPDGETLDGVELRVDKAWDPSDEPILAKTDVDGVATLQVDPGPPVNVLVPAIPVRPPPLPPAVLITGARDLVSGEEPSLGDRRALDGWLARLEPCARFVQYTVDVSLGVRVATSGSVRRVTTGETPLESCAARALSTASLRPGDERVLQLSYRFQPPDLPLLTLQSMQAVVSQPGELQELVATRLLDARLCMPKDIRSGAYPLSLAWEGTRASKALSVSWIPRFYEPDFSAASRACVSQKMSGLTLREPAPADHAGVGSIYVQAAPTRESTAPGHTMMFGYELDVRAVGADGKDIGTTKIRLQPGAVPPVRLRLDPPIAAPGDTVALEILRGPDFSGELPKEMALVHDGAEPLEAELKDRKASFRLPDDAAGWYTVSWGGVQAFAYVPEAGDLHVHLEPGAASVRPGAKGTLTIRTEADGRPIEAAVTLVGLDESLGQLVSLPGPDALDGLRLLPPSQGAAFPGLDIPALVMGRIQGANARAATILRVTGIPSRAERDVWVSIITEGSFDPLAPLTDHFYTVLAALHASVRDWERSAKEGEMLDLDTYAGLWNQSLERTADAKQPVDDAYGRRLELHRLPDDLLALADPRQVVIDGTRLPEDVEPWIPWVRARRQ